MHDLSGEYSAPHIGLGQVSEFSLNPVNPPWEETHIPSVI